MGIKRGQQAEVTVCVMYSITEYVSIYIVYVIWGDDVMIIMQSDFNPVSGVARALYSYQAQSAEELSFQEGALIHLIRCRHGEVCVLCTNQGLKPSETCGLLLPEYRGHKKCRLCRCHPITQCALMNHGWHKVTSSYLSGFGIRNFLLQEILANQIWAAGKQSTWRGKEVAEILEPIDYHLTNIFKNVLLTFISCETIQL